MPLRDRAPSDEDKVDFRPRRPRSPIMAAVCIVLSLGLMWKIAPNLRYAFSSSTPVELHSAADFVAHQYSIASGRPDWQHALYLYPRGEKERVYLFRTVSGPPLWIAALDRHDDLHETWQGRLEHLRQLSFAEDLEAASLKQRQYIEWKPGAPLPTTDRSGRPFHLDGGQAVTVEIEWENRLVVRLSKERFPAEEDARHELGALGLGPLQTLPQESEHFVFVIPAPKAERTSVLAKLELRRIRFFPHREARSAKAGALMLSPAEMAAVRSAYVESSLRLAPGEWVLVEGAAPRGDWWAVGLGFFLVGFVLFNAWYLLRLRQS